MRIRMRDAKLNTSLIPVGAVRSPIIALATGGDRSKTRQHATKARWRNTTSIMYKCTSSQCTSTVQSCISNVPTRALSDGFVSTIT